MHELKCKHCGRTFARAIEAKVHEEQAGEIARLRVQLTAVTERWGQRAQQVLELREANAELEAQLAAEREKVQRLQFALADTEALELGTAERLAAAQAVIEQMRDLLDDCVNSLANYKLLQRRSNDPIGAEVTAKEISSIKSVLALTPNLDALHEARAVAVDALSDKVEAMMKGSAYLPATGVIYAINLEAAARRAKKQATKEEGK